MATTAIVRQNQRMGRRETAERQGRIELELMEERAAALRESARQVAHELKNPLTPIRFAVERLRRHASPETAEAIVAAVKARTR